MHDFPKVEQTTLYASSGVLLPSGESHFQDFTDKTSSPAVNRSNDSLTHDTDAYELLRKETLVEPSSDIFSPASFKKLWNFETLALFSIFFDYLWVP